ncbi:DNA mismatch repair protein [Vibrio jasicida]|uniref:DNA mismatch repair protein n=1 Tax=Vibrio jasicida TaxID=766224 RepID=UPI0028962117|nr:DNA mismatch repair protein [Vibrio jasicida]
MVKKSTYFPPAWLLVLVGLVLNIAAIILTSVVLDKLGKETSLLADQKADNLYSIQLAWNRVETLERKREVLLLHLHLAQSQSVSEEMNNVLRAHLSAWTGEKVSSIEITQLPTLMAEINYAQGNDRNRIDGYYLENLEISEVMSELEENMAWYKSIGLFLQVFGLALILARDLARNP